MSTFPPTSLSDSDSSDYYDDTEPTEPDQVLLSAQQTMGRPCFLYTQHLPTEAEAEGRAITSSWRIALAPSTQSKYSLTPAIKAKLEGMARDSGQGGSDIDQIYRKGGEAKDLWDAISKEVKDKVTLPDKEDKDAIMTRRRAQDEELQRTAHEQNEGSPADPFDQMSDEVDLPQEDEDLSSSLAVVVLPEDVFKQVTTRESVRSGVPFDYAAKDLDYYDGTERASVSGQ